MGEKKVIAVVGATGVQGGGLARAILADPDGGSALRALTRQPDSDNSKALAAAGAEVVKADLDDEASLAAAFQGAYGAYCLTNFWEYFSADKEIAQAENMAKAAKETGGMGLCVARTARSRSRSRWAMRSSRASQRFDSWLAGNNDRIPVA
jgi:uncharacterized protein YbjT (DUF2867 family)